MFLESHGVITLTQYGFRSDYSTSMVILDMVKMRAAWGHGNVALGIFIDTVDYGVLLARMEHYRVRGGSGVAGQLPGEEVPVCGLWGAESGRGRVESGVPQGFCLIYDNDMVRVDRDLSFVLFADDTNIFAEGRDSVELFGRVNGELRELNRWFRCNRLTLNLIKTEYVYFFGSRGRGFRWVASR